jgi:hypothetical protein
MSPWAGTKRVPPARWLVRACACEESLVDGVRHCRGAARGGGGPHVGSRPLVCARVVLYRKCSGREILVLLARTANQFQGGQQAAMVMRDKPAQKLRT